MIGYQLNSFRKKEGESLIRAREIYDFLLNLGYDIAIDDRTENPGVKFKDAELLGIPLQLRIGPKSLAKGLVELKNRLTGDVLEIDKDMMLMMLRNARRT